MIVPVTAMQYEKGKTVFQSVPGIKFVSVSEDEAELAAFITRHQCKACVLGVDIYSGALYDALPEGGLILRFGVGTDGVNREKMKARGLLLANTPGTLDQSVAEHTIFLMGALVRHIVSGNAQVKKGNWSPVTGNEFADLTLAIVGLGNIGARVARIAHQGFGMRVLACELAAPEAAAERLGFSSKSSLLNTLGILNWNADSSVILPQADVVSVHLPVLPATTGYFNSARFAQFKPGALFINTSRGKLVIEEDLAAALDSGQIGAAALDVFENEPYQVSGVDLRTYDNVLMTPHVASNTFTANRKMAAMVVENLRNWMQGEFGKVHSVI